MFIMFEFLHLNAKWRYFTSWARQLYKLDSFSQALGVWINGFIACWLQAKTSSRNATWAASSGGRNTSASSARRQFSCSVWRSLLPSTSSVRLWTARQVIDALSYLCCYFRNKLVGHDVHLFAFCTKPYYFGLWCTIIRTLIAMMCHLVVLSFSVDRMTLFSTKLWAISCQSHDVLEDVKIVMWKVKRAWHVRTMLLNSLVYN